MYAFLYNIIYRKAHMICEVLIMVAANYTAVRNNLKEYCDMASDSGETVIVTRKADKNIVLMSLERYNEMEKEIRNAKYLEKLERAFDQLYSGKGTKHELIED